MRISRSLAAVLCVLTLAATPARAVEPQPPSFRLDRVNVTPGEQVTGVVTVAPEAEDRVVRLERLLPEGWILVRHATLPAAASEVRVRVPSDHYSTYSYRVSTTSEQAAVTSPERRLTVRPAYRPTGAPGDWAHLSTPLTPLPQRWDSCAGPIRYVVNTRRAWAGALDETREALRRISVATGLRFVWAGYTRLVPNGRESQRLPKRADVVIAWVGHKQTPLLSGGALGMARPFADAHGRTTHAQVVLDPLAPRYLRPGFGAAPRLGSLILHELTHVVGLGHANSKKHVMYSGVDKTPSRFGAGDLRGLSRVGAQRGCQFRGE